MPRPQRVVKDYGRKLKLPGFRPGKVPSGVVRKRFRQDIDREVVDRLVPRFWSQAETESRARPDHAAGAGRRRGSTEGEPLVFTAQVEVRPEIQLGDLAGFELPDPPAEPTQEEVDAAIEDIRRRAGGWKTVERAAGQGDLVSVEIDGDHAGGRSRRRTPSRRPLDVEIGSPQVWEELSLAALRPLAPARRASSPHARRAGRGRASAASGCEVRGGQGARAAGRSTTRWPRRSATSRRSPSMRPTCGARLG